ncbi:hypothetical protein BC936DRAFT_148147 [Jimgerdemannia flammicorona]|uniref:PSI domain-containing protein n=1 Tax=Jimgerdemannia flammicorona TaxID=994334 RepID=A0A433DKU9_9FUNG|nr:hypothetical protein BC936DRAFT_148147 [Jimgerdemannia flammicorona]
MHPGCELCNGCRSISARKPHRHRSPSIKMLSHQGIWSRSNTSLLIVMLQYVWWSCMMSLPALGAAVLEDLSFANSPLALLELYSTPLSNSISDSCGVYTNCGSCVAVDSCGFCVKANKCVAGGVWGPAEKDSCGEGAKFDFLFQQCQGSYHSFFSLFTMDQSSVCKDCFTIVTI